MATKLSTPRPGGLRGLFLPKELDFLPPAHLFKGSKPTRLSFSSQRVGLTQRGRNVMKTSLASSPDTILIGFHFLLSSSRLKVERKRRRMLVSSYRI